MRSLRFSYPKALLQTYSVFADPKQASDVIVVPYNSVLTLKWLMEFPDLVVFVDNAALYRVAIESMRVPAPSFDLINSMVSQWAGFNQRQIHSQVGKIMTGFTAPMRFYSPVYPRLMHAVAQLNPFPPMHFIQPGIIDCQGIPIHPFQPTRPSFPPTASSSRARPPPRSSRASW